MLIGWISTRRLARAALVLAASAVPGFRYVIAFRRGGEELSVIAPLAVFAFLVGGRRLGSARAI
ncbi:MAG: hypothetical protein M3Z65_04315 [Chloroflexota bacterium]|nr:hypothetical protein [Chloroflexota bacterium]